MHTPGPWTYDPRSGWINADQCCARGPMHVADIRGWGHLTGGGHGAHGMAREDAAKIQDANAKLICGVHGLLEAAKELANETCRTFGAEDIEPGCCAPCRARRAVAAATS